MKKLIFATGNKDKMREIRMIMAGLPYEVYSMMAQASLRMRLSRPEQWLSI